MFKRNFDLWCLSKIEKTLNLLGDQYIKIAWSTIHEYPEKYWKVFERNFGSLMSRRNWKDFELTHSCNGPILNWISTSGRKPFAKCPVKANVTYVVGILY